MRLPKPPEYLPEDIRQYLSYLVIEAEAELGRRHANAPDGILYIGANQPLRIISEDGTIWELGVTNGGGLTTTEVTI